MKKIFHFIIQSKGGAGKSMLTYLQALKAEKDATVAFIDLDSATASSSRQLQFINLEQDRLFSVDILDEYKNIEREKLFSVIETAAQMPFTKFFIDFGAAESEQFLRLLTMDFTAVDFKAFEQELGAKFIFDIILAGGSSYVACFDYLKSVTTSLQKNFELVPWINEYTFKGHTNLYEEVTRFASSTKGIVSKPRLFGNFFPERVSGIQVINAMKTGKGAAGYTSFAAKIIIRKAMENL